MFARCFFIWKEGGEMKIGAILRVQQPSIYNQLNNRNGSKKERKSKEDHLSFDDFIDKLMRNNKGVDERKCR